MRNFIRTIANAYPHFIPIILSPSSVELLDKLQDSSLLRHRLYTVTLGNLQLKQTTKIDPAGSDHKGYQIRDIKTGNILLEILNDRMRAVRTPSGIVPSGFGDKLESNARYLNRVLETANYIAKQEHEFSLQEAVIDPLHKQIFIAAAEASEEDVNATAYGVMRIPARNNAFHPDPAMIAEIDAHPLLKGGRAIITRASDTNFRVHTHVPFRNTEAAFSALLSILLKHTSTALSLHKHETIIVDIVGDKNLLPSTQKSLTEAAYNNFIQLHKGEPFTATSYLLASPFGHLKRENGKSVLVTVDSFHRLVFTASPQYKFTHASAQSTKLAFGKYLTMLFGSGAACVVMIGDDVALTQPVEVAALASIQAMQRKGFFSTPRENTVHHSSFSQLSTKNK